MSPKTSCPRAVSTHLEQQSAPAPQAGSDGDLRQQGIETNTSDPSPDREGRWLYHVDELNCTLERIKTLSNALFCVTQCNSDFFHNGDAPTEETLPLSRLAMDLCDKADGHVDALYRHIRKLEGRDEIEQILKDRTRLDPEGKELLDEAAAFLHTATPEMKEDFRQRFETIKQKMKTRKGAETAEPDSLKGKGRVNRR